MVGASELTLGESQGDEMLSNDQAKQIQFIIDLVHSHEVGKLVKDVALKHIELVVQSQFSFADFQSEFRQAMADEAPPTERTPTLK